jgi:hypothetical protein
LNNNISPSATHVISSFEEIVREHFPEINILPAIGDRTCFNCKSQDSCDNSQLSAIEKSIREMLQWREYDEVIQMKNIFNKLEKKSKTISDDQDARQLYNEFKDEEKKLQKRIHKLFPKINRWSSLITMVSIPVVVAGVATKSTIVSGIGAGIAGTSQILKSYTDYLTNKTRWICYKQEQSL